jgi:hypothetical protein
MKASAWMSRYPRQRDASRIGHFTQFSMHVARVVTRGAARGAWAAIHLDAWLRQFHHRWETDPTYRKRFSIVAGVSALVSMCMFAVIVSAVANAAIQSADGGGLGAHNAFGSSAYGAPVFPTETIPPWTPGTVPYGGVVPSSGTPIPRPTTPPTPTSVATVEATPQATATAGGVPTTCDGTQSGATWALAPCPQIAGQAGTLTISAPGHASAALTISITFGTCSACTVAYPAGQYSLDASGNARVSYTVPAGAAHGTTPITGTVNIASGPTLVINAAPVQ